MVLVGEIAGVPSSNRGKAFLATGMAATAFPAAMGLVSAFDGDYVPGSLLAFNPVISSVAAAVIYNIVKSPQSEFGDNASAFISVYPSVGRAFGDDGYVTTYGLELRF